MGFDGYYDVGGCKQQVSIQGLRDKKKLCMNLMFNPVHIFSQKNSMKFIELQSPSYNQEV